MLEAEDIDDDYFTPVPSTSLASIFGGPQNQNTQSENESLKYTPPKKQVPRDNSIITVTENVETKEDEAKLNECMLACAVTAYEWINNNYLPRGKLGFAIVKIGKTTTHSIVLYNTNKTSLSTAKITKKLSIMLKGNNYISYYDNLSKYWSIHGNKEDLNKILELLKSLGVDIQTLTTDQTLPEPINTEIEDSVCTVIQDKESDTDSSVNRKTKASLLNRMANMGHSVLPPGTLVNKSSESSDTDDLANQPPKVKPKPHKTTIKRISIDKIKPDPNATESIKIPIAKIDQPSTASQLLNSSSLGSGNGQLVPITNTSFLPAYGNCTNNEMSLFMTEQRMNSSELRININRTTDKLDQVLEKLKVLERSDGDKGNNFQMELMQKLLCEYESKIRKYEQILASVRTENNTVIKSEISNLQIVVEEKDKIISNLNEKFDQSELLKQVTNLKNKLFEKTAELEKMSRDLEECRKIKEDKSEQDLENSVKDIMNDVFHSISVNFKDSETYDGETVKKVLASIIKKSTIQSLK